MLDDSDPGGGEISGFSARASSREVSLGGPGLTLLMTPSPVLSTPSIISRISASVRLSPASSAILCHHAGFRDSAGARGLCVGWHSSTGLVHAPWEPEKSPHAAKHPRASAGQ